jgi:uncharacterized protein with GYD domain
MPRFMFIANYSPEGAKGLMSAGGTARRSAVEKMVTGLGGRIESFDFAFGNDDLYILAELPDNKAATAVALTVNSTGMVRVRTVVLVTPGEVDAARQIHPDYQPPATG